SLLRRQKSAKFCPLIAYHDKFQNSWNRPAEALVERKVIMRFIWDALETVDRLKHSAQKQADKLRAKPHVWQQAEEATKDVRKPQKAIEFDN
ncbi:MAG: hypothetical protein MK135_12010, partial [Polyangiaceae bacterium]|nr:hypothetical protein [Polyangiaceae bacterium]